MTEALNLGTRGRPEAARSKQESAAHSEWPVSHYSSTVPTQPIDDLSTFDPPRRAAPVSGRTAASRPRPTPDPDSTKGEPGSRGLLGRAGRRPRVDDPVDSGPRTGSHPTPSGSSAASSTCRSTASTGTSGRRAAQQSRHHLGRRAGRPPGPDLLGSGPRGEPGSQRASSRWASRRATGSRSICR